MRKTLYIPIDLIIEDTVECPKLVKRGDILTLQIKVFNNQALADLTGQTVDLILRKSDNTLIEKTVTSVANGVVTAELDIQATVVSGIVSGELQLVDTNGRSSTNTFTFNVSTSIADDVLEVSQNDIQTLTELKALIADGQVIITEYEDNILAIANSIEAIEALGNIKSYIDTNLVDLQNANAQATANIVNENVANTELESTIADATVIKNALETFSNEHEDITDLVATVTSHSTQLSQNTQQISSVEQLNNNRLSIDTFKITNNNNYSAWPQDKCFSLNNKLYMIYNKGTGHPSQDQRPVLNVSSDYGKSWTEIGELFNDNSYTLGNYCFGAGSEGIRFYSVITLRGNTYDVGVTKHLLLYGALSNGDVPQIKNMVSKEITISSNGKVPILFHSFASLPDGSIAFGYHYEDGEVGIAKTFNLGDTWETHILYTSGEMGGATLLCEPTLYYDSTAGKLVGFLRSQNTSLSKPVFFISSDNAQTFTKYVTTVNTAFSPIPIKRIGNTYYGVYIERFDSCRFYLLEGDVIEVLTNGWSAFKSTLIGNLHKYGSGASGTGVPSIVVLNNNLYIFYSMENPNGTVDIYQSILKTDISDNVLLNADVAKPIKISDTKTAIRLSHSVAQTLSATVSTKINFTVSYDDFNEFDTTNSKIVFKKNGVYSINFSLDLGTVLDGNSSRLMIYKNGVEDRRLAWSLAGANSIEVLMGSVTDKFNKNDALEFYAYSSNAITTRVSSLTSYVMVHRIN